MVLKSISINLLIVLISLNIHLIYSSSDQCLYSLNGYVNDCNCTIERIDKYNNYQLHPRINELLKKDYFRYFKVNLNKICQFWPDDMRCSIKDCLVKTCDDADLPHSFQKYLKSGNIDEIFKHEESGEPCEQTNPLGHLNDTITEDNLRTFEDWRKYDDAQDTFCEPDEEYLEKAQYVDLIINPERFTGYRAPHASKIWNSIYQENCFSEAETVPLKANFADIYSKPIDSCFEKRVFYRLVSGLHTSISVHLCSRFLHKGVLNQPDTWGPSRQEFLKRFDPKLTNGQGLQWLKNLYFIYLVELRAIAKAAPYLEKETFYTGNTIDDDETKEGVYDLLQTIKSFKFHFDESKMFKGDPNEALNLKLEFQQKFRNITKIMDCVGCDKCRLWGKLQTQALGTALKILFSGKLIGPNSTVNADSKQNFQLTRSEIVSLFNGFGRLSTSISEIENFRDILAIK